MKPLRECVRCLSTRDVEMHHYAGRAWEFRAPLCRDCHVEATVALKRLKIDTSGNGQNVALEAYKAALFFQWFMLERLEKEINNREGCSK